MNQEKTIVSIAKKNKPAVKVSISFFVDSEQPPENKSLKKLSKFISYTLFLKTIKFSKKKSDLLKALAKIRAKLGSSCYTNPSFKNHKFFKVLFWGRFRENDRELIDC